MVNGNDPSQAAAETASNEAKRPPKLVTNRRGHDRSLGGKNGSGWKGAARNEVSGPAKSMIAATTQKES